jgi:DNA-directed RNA polymerase subunit RPC12/RpoP
MILEENENYDQYIKTKCTWCGAKIPGKRTHYTYFGNSCKECSARAERFVKGVRGTKNGVTYRIRPYTDKEKKQMILDRLIQVKQNNL